MNTKFPQHAGKISLNDDYKLALDGVEIGSRRDLELLIGGHWILGFVFATSRGDLVWSCWKEFVHISLHYLMQARWPQEAR